MAARLRTARPTAATAAWPRLAMTVALGLAAAACATPSRGPTYPPAGASPVVATTETLAAHDAVVAALTPLGIPIKDSNEPFRPPEGAWFAAAPRSVIELDAPGDGPITFIVLYAFASPADADAAAHDQAAFVSSGSGRVYFPSGTRFTIRELGSVVVFVADAPGGDPQQLQVEQALETLGTGVAVPA